jgi:hypothetical protein
VYGLTALHIITKDIPQWFWSTFEHVDNPDIDVRIGTQFVDRHTNGGQNLPPEVLNTKWQNYRLKGTQTDFVDLTGEPTILANAIIEQGFQGTSSCITCHSRAAIDQSGSNPPVFEKITVRSLHPELGPPNGIFAQFTGSIGAPDPRLFNGTEPLDVKFTQLDFMWSMTSANPKGECPD